MMNSLLNTHGRRQPIKRLVPSADTRNSTAGTLGCFVGLPIAILSFVGVVYVAIELGLEVGEFTSFLVILGIAMSLLVARGISNFLADQWRGLALRNMDPPVMFVLPEQIRIGDMFTVIYHQTIPKPLFIRELVLQLVSVTTLKREISDIKDDFRKDEKIHQAIRRKGREYEAGEIFHREALFAIPHDAPPTRDTNENAEQWLIHVHLFVKGRHDFEQDFVLQVESAQ
jgi:hypothetical protein